MKQSKCHICDKEVNSKAIMTHAKVHPEVESDDFKYRQLSYDYGDYDLSEDNIRKLYVKLGYSEKELAGDHFPKMNKNRKIITFLLEYYDIPKRSKAERCNTDRCLTKRKETFIENYGVDHPVKNKVVRDKIRKTCIERYGVDSNLKIPLLQNLIGVGSKLEQRVEEFLVVCNIRYEPQYPILGKAFDFLCHNNGESFLLEVNGDYWHANPNKYSANDVVKTHTGDKMKAEDIWLKDSEKRKIGEERYPVRVVWEGDLNNDFLGTMYKILNYGRFK